MEEFDFLDNCSTEDEDFDSVTLEDIIKSEL